MIDHWTLHINDPRRQEAIASDPYNIWSKPLGDVWAEFRKFAGVYHIRFLDLVDFLYRPGDTEVFCWPEPGVDSETIDQLYLNQVYPVVRSFTGSLVVHASAVALDDRAILFTGESGRGKSTLATFLSTKGNRLISDDGVVLATKGNCLSVEPGHASIRLWIDSSQAVLGNRTSPPSTLSNLFKQRITEVPGVSFADVNISAGSVFHLEEPTSGRIAVNRLSEREAFFTCHRHLFILDDREAKINATHFEQLSKLASNIPHFSLAYPRRFDVLGEIYSEIMQQLSEEC